MLFWFVMLFFFFKQKTAYEMRISDWSSDVCSSDLPLASKVYANEMIRGAPHTRDFLKNELRNLVTSKAKVLEAWAAAGKIEPEIGRASCRERVCQYV